MWLGVWCGTNARVSGRAWLTAWVVCGNTFTLIAAGRKARTRCERCGDPLLHGARSVVLHLDLKALAISSRADVRSPISDRVVWLAFRATSTGLTQIGDFTRT